jgi:5-methylcytosine-specific restriction endonuclease McrA
MNQRILVLNRYYFPVGVCDERKTFGNIFSEVVYPLDIIYEVDENGNKTDNVDYFNVIKGSKDWLDLPVRDYDDYILTTKGKVRVPSVVVCASYDRIPHKQVYFPTKLNIIKRDNNTCCYSGIKLNKDTSTIDHISPRSKHIGNANTWENQVCCHRELNIWKSDRKPEECDLSKFNPKDDELKAWVATQGKKLRLKKSPTKPKNGFVFVDFLEEWDLFLKNV